MDNFTERQRRIYDFLYRHPVGVLSTLTTDTEPHGVVISFSINEEFEIYFLTKTATKKYENLMRYNKVVLTVFDAPSQTTVQIRGRAFEQTDPLAVNSIAGVLLSTHLRSGGKGLPPVAKLKAGAYAAFKIEPSFIRMAVYSEADSDDDTELFESVESFEFELAF